MAVNSDDETGGIMGPTFSGLSQERRPEPLPACATCPKAMWYRTEKRLRAFCREIRHITWEDGEREPILQCDGREVELLRLESR